MKIGTTIFLTIFLLISAFVLLGGFASQSVHLSDDLNKLEVDYQRLQENDAAIIQDLDTRLLNATNNAANEAQEKDEALRQLTEANARLSNLEAALESERALKEQVVNANQELQNRAIEVQSQLSNLEVALESERALKEQVVNANQELQNRAIEVQSQLSNLEVALESERALKEQVINSSEKLCENPSAVLRTCVLPASEGRGSKNAKVAPLGDESFSELKQVPALIIVFFTLVFFGFLGAAYRYFLGKKAINMEIECEEAIVHRQPCSRERNLEQVLFVMMTRDQVSDYIRTRRNQGS